MRSPKRRPRKVVDDATGVTCATGQGVVREEVWQDESGAVVRYNLAFINHFVCNIDNGRVLGYDNAHAVHHRHFKGRVEEFEYKGYDILFGLFMAEVEVLRRERA